MSFGEAIQSVFRNYAEFTGRATRPEFWWWALFNLLVAGALNLFNMIRIGENAYLGSLLAGIGASRSCSRTSLWPSDDCATPATAGATCSGSGPARRDLRAHHPVGAAHEAGGAGHDRRDRVAART